MSTTYYLAHGDMSETYLAHHGVRGQKWGVRRFQNRDGSYTAAGEGRYASLSRHGQRKYDYIERRYGRKLAKSQAIDERLLAKRKKNRDAMVSRIDKLEAKKSAASNNRSAERINGKIQKRKVRLKDFDEGTRVIKAGQNQYNKNIADYKNLKQKSLTDKSVKRSDSGKEIRRNYRRQNFLDSYYGNSNLTKVGYAGDIARKEGAKNKMKATASDSAVTKRVKSDYNKLSDKEFARKYQTTKKVYAKRVSKYGDPYMNAPLAKLGKKLGSKR